MNDDLLRLAPSQRAEVRRRLRVVQRFIEKPGRRSAETSAAELGICVAQFYNLVKAWKNLRQPEALVHRAGIHEKPSSMNADQTRIFHLERKSLQGLPKKQIIEGIRNAMAINCLPIPTVTSLYDLLRRFPPGSIDQAIKTECDYVVDWTVLELPVDFGTGALERPLACMVIDTAADSVVGIALAQGQPAEETIVRALEHLYKTNGMPFHSKIQARPKIGIVTLIKPGTILNFDGIAGTVLKADFVPLDTTQLGTCIDALLGSRHAGIIIKARSAVRSGLRRPRASVTIPRLTVHEAEQFVRARFLKLQP